MAKSASFVVAILLLFTVSFAARPLVNEVTDGAPELAPAPAPLLAWGPVLVPSIPGLDDGPDSLIPNPGFVEAYLPDQEASDKKLGA